MKIWLLVAVSALAFVSILAGFILLAIKEKRLKEADSKHSEEFKRIKSAGDNGYEYAFTEYYNHGLSQILYQHNL